MKTTSGTAAPLPDSEWTVGEAAAHLALANELLADLAAGHERPYGDGTPQSLAAANAQTLAKFGERGAQPLAAMITEQARLFLDAVDRVTRDESAPSPPLVTPLGPMDRHVLASYMLTHMLGHGYDLARALKRPHMIDRDRVGMCMPFMLSVMPRVVDTDAIADLAVRYAIRLLGGAEFGVSLGDGAVDVSPTPLERPDCTILIEPVTFLLIALGRRNPWRAIGQGQVLAWGAGRGSRPASRPCSPRLDPSNARAGTAPHEGCAESVPAEPPAAPRSQRADEFVRPIRLGFVDRRARRAVHLHRLAVAATGRREDGTEQCPGTAGHTHSSVGQAASTSSWAGI